MISNKTVIKRLAMVFVVLVFGSVAYAQQLKVAEVAGKVVDGVGTVGKIVSTGTKGPVFVFDEYHTSRVGQLQMAIMLLRLHDRHGLTTFGLEGAIQSSRPLAGDWFHQAGGEGARLAREDVAVRMLAEGEISAMEFMALLFPDVNVYGIELQEEYGVELDVKGEQDPRIVYLLAIAEQGLTQTAISRINDLVNQGKQKEALEYMMSRDPWVSRQWKALNDTSTISLQHIVDQIREIQRKASTLGVQVEFQVKQDMEANLRFYEMALQRDITMTNYILGLPGVAIGTPAAMTIGAAHTDRVIELLRSRNVSLAHMRPLALNPKYGNLSNEQFKRKSQKKWARTSPGTLGRLLNAGHKPPPVIGTATGKSYASMNLAAILIADAARARKRIPEDIWTQIASLPELRIDRASFTFDGFDVIFRAWLKNTDGKEREVWARVGTLDTPEQAMDLEQKLSQAIADLGGGSKIPPREPPTNSQSAKDEGPADGKRGDVVINRVNTRVLAVYAATKSEATRTGRISS
jgi:hypothetical protein